MAALLFELEKDIATHLLSQLKHHTLSPTRAAAIARYVLHTLPPDISEEQIRSKLPELNSAFYELSETLAQYLDQVHIHSDSDEIDQLHAHLQQLKHPNAPEIIHQNFSQSHA